MVFKRLPNIKLYWSGDALFSVPTLPRYMSRLRFWALWRNLHVIGGKRPTKKSVSNKIKTVLNTLSRTFLECYSPAQELSVDESMIKYNGHVGGKVCIHTYFSKLLKLSFNIDYMYFWLIYILF